MLIPGLFVGASPTSFAVDSFKARPGSSDLAAYPNQGLTQKALDVSSDEFSELVPRSYRVNYGKAVVGRGEKVGSTMLPTKKKHRMSHSKLSLSSLNRIRILTKQRK